MNICTDHEVRGNDIGMDSKIAVVCELNRLSRLTDQLGESFTYHLPKLTRTTKQGRALIFRHTQAEPRACREILMNLSGAMRQRVIIAMQSRGKPPI